MCRGKDLKFLHAVINESLRIHSTGSIGLASLVPQGLDIDICGYYFPAATVLCVPTFTVRHSTEVWGSDTDEFVPERWEHLTERQKKAFVPFSCRPKAY
jgi:benzoate 4-monooxygenase